MSYAMWKGSFLYGWPMWILRSICALWNAVNCMAYGHEEKEERRSDRMVSIADRRPVSIVVLSYPLTGAS
jgi:hypothetical protein